MNCQNCDQPIDQGASFCGNCGHSVFATPPNTAPQPAVAYAPAPTVIQPSTTLPTAQAATAPPHQGQVTAPIAASNPVYPAPLNTTPVTPYNSGNLSPAPVNQPAYALPQPFNSQSHKGETKAIVGLLVAVLGIPGALIPILGLVLGITGLIIGTTSRHVKKGISTASIIIGILAILLSLAAWTYFFTQDPRIKNSSLSNVSQDIDTPCFTLKVSSDLRVKNAAGGCTFEAMDGESVEFSTVVYSIKSVKDPALNASNFDSFAKNAAPIFVKAASTADRTFKLTSEKSTKFAGEQAYVISAKSDQDTHIELVMVLKNAPNGDNIFIIAVGGLANSTLITELEKSFDWK